MAVRRRRTASSLADALLAVRRQIVAMPLQALGDPAAARTRVAAEPLDVPDAHRRELACDLPELADVGLAGLRQVRFVRLEACLDLIGASRHVRAQLLDVGEARWIRPR